MITIRRADDRGHAELGWLDSRHTFSFGHYYDPAHMGFGPLRVINEDRVRPGGGFDTHGHKDMEIISYVLDGALAHKDSLGNGSEIRPGDVQRMSAGTGIRHSEFNASSDDPVHFLQIWILPETENMAPGYEQKAFPAAERQGRLRLVGARDGREGALTIHQDVDLYSGLLEPGDEIVHTMAPGRMAWVQVAGGAIEIGDETLAAGDGAAISEENGVAIRSAVRSEILLFDMGQVADTKEGNQS